MAKGQTVKSSRRAKRPSRICRICDIFPAKGARSYCRLCEQIRDRLAAVTNLPGAAQLLWAEREHIIRGLSRELSSEYSPGSRNYLGFRFPPSYFDLSQAEQIHRLFSASNVLVTDSWGTHLQALKSRRAQTNQDFEDFASWMHKQWGHEEKSDKRKRRQ